MLFFVGSIVDGSKVVHAAVVYRPEQKPPRLNKDQSNALVYLGDDKWEVQGDGKTVRVLLFALGFSH